MDPHMHTRTRHLPAFGCWNERRNERSIDRHRYAVPMVRERRRVRRAMAPGSGALEIEGRSQEVWFNADDYAINPMELLQPLHRHALDQGVQFHYRSEVLDLGGGVAVIESNSGRYDVRCSKAFLCTNAFAKELHVASDVVASRGQILVTKPCRLPTTPVLGFLQDGHDYFRFIDGRLLVGGGRQHFGASETTDEIQVTEPVQLYLESLAQTIAGPASIEIHHRWAGLMGLPNGSHSSARALETTTAIDDRTEVVAGFGGWGVTLAPYLAQLLDQRIT